MVTNILITQILAILLLNLKFVQIFGKFLSSSMFMDLIEPMKPFKACNRDTG